MTKTCPSCGFVSNSEARFCRMCGALLPRVPEEFGDDAVSPSASTVPLTNSRPTTGALSPHDTGSPERARTGRLAGVEMAEFLRRAGEAGDAAFPEDAGEEPVDAGERPLTIRVRPIDTPPAATIDPPPQAAAPTTPAPPNSAPLPDDARDGDDATLIAPVKVHDAQPSATNAVAPPSAAVTPAPLVVDRSRAASESSGGGARSAALSNSPARRPTEDRALRIWAGAAVFGVVALLVASVVVGAWYVVHRLRRAPAAETTTAATNTPAPATEEARQSATAKLAEAEQLIAAGSTSEAVARLREAAALDPANAEPHRRLAHLLLAEGARRTAIEELRAAVRIDASDAGSWRDLASAQSAEGLHAAAAESYRSLFAASAESARNDRLQLAYADALRLSGRATEAQALYKRLASSRVAEVARASRQRVATANDNEEANANANGARESAATNAATNDAAREARVNAESARASDANKSAAEARPSPTALPVAASPKDHYARGVELWRTNRAAALAEMGTAAQSGNADASYYLGLNLAEGRDPRSLRRAELVAALTYFQRARRSHYASEARRYEDSLTREYDRRRAGGEP
jgi:hypothetical protein